jgi:GH3 auxin-responsive promoter
VSNTALSLPWLAANFPGYLAFRHALDHPQSTQRALLRGYLSRGAATAFGRAHGFAEIRSAEEYRRRVPLASWVEVAPWVERIRAGEQAVLTGSRVRTLEPTGGSSAATKLIPYTAELQREIRRAVAPWVFDLYRQRPRLALGPAYWSISALASEQDDAPAAVRIGFEDDAAYLGGFWQRLAGATLAVPAAVRHIPAGDSFRYATLLFLLRRRDLSLVSVWHPSFLTLLLEALPRYWCALLDDVEHGTLTPPTAIPSRVRGGLERLLAPLPRRAAELRHLDPQQPGRLWPRLGLISCWGDAHAALALTALAGAFPGVEIQPKGLLATEAFVTIPFAGKWPLALRSHLFELLPDGEPDRPRFAWELDDGGVYTVVVTTGGGLYRYQLEDRVRVEGFAGRTPSLRFLGREGHVCDLRGEKLHEAFVAAALASAFQRVGLVPRFALLAPADSPPVGYTLYLDATDPPPPGLAAIVDGELAASPPYRLCRALGQLAPVTLVVAGESASSRYLERCRQRGQRLGDVKALALSPQGGWAEVFARR